LTSVGAHIVEFCSTISVKTIKLFVLFNGQGLSFQKQVWHFLAQKNSMRTQKYGSWLIQNEKKYFLK